MWCTLMMNHNNSLYETTSNPSNIHVQSSYAVSKPPRSASLLGFCLVLRGDDGPRRSNQIEEDDILKQQKRKRSRKVSRLGLSTSRLGQIQRGRSLQ